MKVAPRERMRRIPTAVPLDIQACHELLKAGRADEFEARLRKLGRSDPAAAAELFLALINHYFPELRRES